MKFHYFVCDKNPVSNEQDAYLCSEEAPLFREIEPMLPSAVQIVLFHSLLLHLLLLPEDVVHIEHYLQQGLYYDSQSIVFESWDCFTFL